MPDGRTVLFLALTAMTWAIPLALWLRHHLLEPEQKDLLGLFSIEDEHAARSLDNRVVSVLHELVLAVAAGGIHCGEQKLRILELIPAGRREPEVNVARVVAHPASAFP